MRHMRGFTLLELIIVIGIFGVLSAMAYGGLNSVLKSRVHVEQALARTAQYQKAYLRLRNDFQQMQNRPARDAYGELQPAFLTDRENRVVFTRGGWRNPADLPRATLERVSYHYDFDRKTLIRGSYRVLDLTQDSQPVEVELLDKVETVQWRFLGNSREWSNEWPPRDLRQTSGASLPPPLAVELTLQTGDFGELRFLFRSGLDPVPAGQNGAPG